MTETQINDVADATKLTIGSGVTLVGWSDRQAYTVVSISGSGKTIKARRDTATLLNGMTSDAADKLVMGQGGFCGHVAGVQRYAYKSDADGDIITIRVTSKGMIAGGKRVISGRHEHYDYNF